MSFTFGTPKTASGFTLPTTSAPAASTAPTFQFSSGTGAGDATAAAKPMTGLFGTPSTVSAAAPAGFSLSTAPVKTTGGLSFGNAPSAGGFGFASPTTATTTAVTTTQAPLNLTTAVASTTTSALGSLLAATTTTTTAATAPPSLSFLVTPTTASTIVSSAPTATAAFGFSSTTATPSSAAQFSLPTTAASSQATTTTATVQSVLPQTGTLTFGQLEDAINKWTVQMEDQQKIFINQARQLTAWDRLLVANGEKIVNISNGLERISQQQQQLDHELDFVLSQQKELEDLIVPLEKELADVPIHDHDRHNIYQIAETLDSQLKQMSDDLNQAIDHINEAAKNQNSDDPISQIAKILNAHMNSLQWIDRNTAQINAHLDQISKMQEQMIHFRS